MKQARSPLQALDSKRENSILAHCANYFCFAWHPARLWSSDCSCTGIHGDANFSWGADVCMKTPFPIMMEQLLRNACGEPSSQGLWKSGSAGRCAIAAWRRSSFLTTTMIFRPYVRPRGLTRAISETGCNPYGRGAFKKKTAIVKQPTRRQAAAGS